MKKETKETIIVVIAVILAVYVLLWSTYPRDVEQPMPEPLNMSETTQETAPKAAPAT